MSENISTANTDYDGEDVLVDVDPDCAVDESIDDDDSKDVDAEDAADAADESRRWKMHNFLNPLKVCYQLSGYPHLLGLYWILVSLPVTSCSAERALSRLRIIKNRLRSTMNDEWMNSLMVISAEKELLSSIKTDDIVDKFATVSDKLKRNLIY